ncbi:MAG TPA: hypothetical protein ENI85_00455 [Deltaproteobacteria bacterium]|nr:hypothetical protein [Deltaproteobacteria bacterium]
MAIRDQPRVSLFPFMSVLACTIGALMMLLVVMSLGAVVAGDASARVGAEAVGPGSGGGAGSLGAEAALARAESLWGDVDRALEQAGLPPGLSKSSIDRELARLREKEELVASLARLEAEQARVAEEGETIETTVAVLESRRETLPILIDPTGLSQELRPYFVECDEAGVTAYRATDDFRYFVSNQDLSTGGVFGRYLRRVRVEPGALLVLLVRPDGVATTRRAERIAHAAGIARIARLPLPGRGELDWSLLRRAEAGTN